MVASSPTKVFALQAVFEFGEQRPEYAVRVLNERAVRASAGILFFFAMVTFMNAWLVGNFQPTRVFVVAFWVEFFIRIFINPRYAPAMIVGQWVVRKQQPDYVGAPQKRFAWGIGFTLACTMLYLLVIKQVIGPINMLVCGLCLVLMFFETAFGICIGCKVYNWFNKEQAQLCPGGVCEVPTWDKPQFSIAQLVVLLVFGAGVVVTAQWVYSTAASQQSGMAMQGQSGLGAPADLAPSAAPVNPANTERCKVPAFAKTIGHEEKWKLHNNCR